MAALSLFYCYASEDEALCDQLEKHLRQLQRQGLISTWHERKILPGGARAHEIDTHLETASIILLLVSPDFLASDYCYDIQMQRALERHQLGLARVIPIILRPCDWQHSPLKDLQCLPRDGKPVTQWSDQDGAFNTITQGLRRVIEQQALAHPPVPLSPLDRQNRIRMLKQVRATWIDGLLKQSLHHEARIELHLQDRPDMLANPWRFQVQELDQAPLTLPAGTSIVQVYDRAEGELLILGEPGAGKTTLLLELTAALLERAENDEQLPMPIVFHLSSWAEKRQALSLWLVEELSTKYQVPRKIGKGWIDADQVLPLLDGLDEVAKEVRSACVEQINDYYRSRLERGSRPVVVCCRSEEYIALSIPVMVQHAVSILPLADEQINIYLEQAGEQVRGLKQALNEDAELHSLARQPLMLSIFTFAYQGVTTVEVPIGTTGEEVLHAIFARYVEHVLKRRGQSRRWMPEQMIGWLSFLAKQMQQHSQTVFSVESLQPTWLSRRRRILYQWCVGLVVGLLWGLVSGLVAWLAVVPSVGLVAGPVVGLAVVPVVALVVGLDARIRPVEELTWSWKNARFALVVGLVSMLVSVLVFGLVDVLVEGLTGELGVILIGLAVGLVAGLVAMLSRRQIPQRLSLDPNEGIWRSGRSGMTVGLLGCLLFGLFFGLFFALFIALVSGFRFYRLLFALSIGLLSGWFLGLVIGLLVALFFGLGAFTKHFFLRFFLSLRGNLPWNLVPFLDEAAERLLLRKVGGSYIFVHRMLLDYFADLEYNISNGCI